jgi:chaperone required for assembly of F1-ATPase
MRRFWKEAGVAETPDGLIIALDGKPMRLPGGPPLCLSNRALADAIAAEWQAAGGTKGGEMDFSHVPLTRLAGTAQERIAPDPGPVVDALAKYGESDLLCYRTDAPHALAEREAREWQPWLNWAALSLDAPLHSTVGVMHVKQNATALAALRHVLAAQNANVLAGLGVAVPALGSLVLGLALAAGRLTAAQAHDLATLDERFQEELWGADEEALARRRLIGADLAMAERFMVLAQG